MKKYTSALFVAAALVLAMGSTSAFAFLTQTLCEASCSSGNCAQGADNVWRCQHGGPQISIDHGINPAASAKITEVILGGGTPNYRDFSQFFPTSNDFYAYVKVIQPQIIAMKTRVSKVLGVLGVQSTAIEFTPPTPGPGMENRLGLSGGPCNAETYTITSEFGNSTVTIYTSANGNTYQTLAGCKLANAAGGR